MSIRNKKEKDFVTEICTTKIVSNKQKNQKFVFSNLPTEKCLPHEIKYEQTKDFFYKIEEEEKKNGKKKIFIVSRSIKIQSHGLFSNGFRWSDFFLSRDVAGINFEISWMSKESSSNFVISSETFLDKMITTILNFELQKTLNTFRL